jgi:hypothetical protein
MKIYILIVCLAGQVMTHAQVSIGKPTADSSALLDLASTQKGFLLPRGSQTQRTALHAQGNGMLFYQQSSPEGFYHYKKTTLPPAWLPLLPYDLQQNLHLATHRMLGNRIYSGGISIDQGSLTVQTVSPGRGLPVRSSLMIYNGSERADFSDVNLLSFKTVFGPNLYSIRLASMPYNYFGIYQNSSGDPFLRLLIAGNSIYFGIPPPNNFYDALRIPLRIDGNLKFTGNIALGFQYDYVDYTLSAHSYGKYDCQCGSGKLIVSGGGGGRDGGDPQQNVLVKYSGPISDNVWRILVYNNTNSAKVVRVYAICSHIQHP